MWYTKEVFSMKIEFNKTGAERKALVKAMGEILGVKPQYLGMPTAAYEVDYFHIDRNGVVEFDDRADTVEVENLLERLAERGFTAAETPTGATEHETGGSDAPTPENAPQGENEGLTVAVPREGFTEAALENLRKLIDSKAALIKKALGVESLPIDVADEKISFPWFTETDGDSAKAYTHFITALCDMARNAKRVTATEKTVDNEKYAFRCFLLRLGFIGAEYKAERKVLLRNLTGSGAFKAGAKCSSREA